MLKRGKQNKKLGDVVTVKMWKGMTMYSLTLEERATCDEDCLQWDNCYGNNMPFAHRFDHTHKDFYPSLEAQLKQLNGKHQSGFVVRTHVLGDFFNTRYIKQWGKWLNKFPNLHVFGYTHWALASDLGQLIQTLNNEHKQRFKVRFSDDLSTDFSAHVAKSHTDQASLLPKAIVCPEQTGKTDSCTTCGYCWSSENPIIFVEH